tara:strand:- start:25 stop:615 length:591 start_codon:yes stop_codon:yes gene_type:complete
MPLWGASDSDESKPKWLTTAEKKTVYAKAEGWVHEAFNADMGNNNPSATPEVLVCVNALTTALGAATITSCEFITTAWDASAGGTLQVRVRWNEAVDVVIGSSSGFKIVVNRTPDGGSAASHTLKAVAATGTNEIVFELAIAGGSPVEALDSFAIIEQSLTYGAGASCKDAGTDTAAEVVITSAQATAAGTLVATA